VLSGGRFITDRRGNANIVFTEIMFGSGGVRGGICLAQDIKLRKGNQLLVGSGKLFGNRMGSKGSFVL